jgi:GNAT superfamily N-acetyltransferase
MAEFRTRSFEPSDYPFLVQIHDSLFPNHPYFRRREEYEDSCYRSTRYQMKRFIAETKSHQVVGFGEYKHLFFQFRPRKFALDIEVLPQWQGKGVGGMLYDKLVEELTKDAAETAWPLVLSTHESANRFLRKRGFVEKRRTLESRLDLKSFESAELARAAEEIEAGGIVISSLSLEFRRDSEAGRKLKDLEDSGAGDVPGVVVDLPMSFHDYEIVILRSPIMVWDGSFVAKEGEAFVGESSLLESGIEGVIDQGFTVVRPGHRGRNVAQAVKLKTALYARTKGARFIRTHNDSENHAMLAVNRKMGFVKTAEWITFEKQL